MQVVREGFPSAQLLVLGPVAPFGTPPEDRDRLNLALVDDTHAGSTPSIKAVAEHGFQIGEWKTMVDQAKGHPDNVGLRRVAEHVAEDVRRLVAPTT